MIKIVLGFLLMFSGFFIGIQMFRNLNGKEKWALTKLVSYSILCAVLATMVLTAFVLIF
jgi:uncharacterized membrane protein HdeD (DUF308 family)